jgi:hypothetical protein
VDKARDAPTLLWIAAGGAEGEGEGQMEVLLALIQGPRRGAAPGARASALNDQALFPILASTTGARAQHSGRMHADEASTPVDPTLPPAPFSAQSDPLTVSSSLHDEEHLSTARCPRSHELQAFERPSMLPSRLTVTLSAHTLSSFEATTGRYLPPRRDDGERFNWGSRKSLTS